MKHIKVFEEFGGREKEVVFTGKRNPRFRTKDIPQGHELRMMFPGKFRK
jgi:hypothetical protein